MNFLLRNTAAVIGLLLVFSYAIYAKTENAAVLNSNLPGNDPSLSAILSDTMKQAGYNVTEISASDLQDKSKLSNKDYDLLVLPNSANLPAASIEPITAYLKGGGNIIALETPMWQNAYVKIDNKWTTIEQYQIESASTPVENELFQFTPESLNLWERGAFDMKIPTKIEASSESSVVGSKSLHVVIPKHDGWDNLRSPKLTKPFADDETLTVVVAKGDSNTRVLSIEWEERDNSRWIAVVSLSEKWKKYILRPEDFRYWKSNPERGRGNDKFNPQNAVNIAVGVSFSHTGFTTGRHEYWVSSIGTARMDDEIAKYMTAVDLPAMDTLAPAYKFFDSNDVENLIVRNDQSIVEAVSLNNVETKSSSPRPKAGGFDKNRTWRWIPLVDALSPKGEWRGVPATMLIHTSGDYKGGIWASFSIKDSDWYKNPTSQSIIRNIAERMKNDLYILDAGSNFYTYFSDQRMTLGMNAANLGAEKRTGITGKVRVIDNASGKQVVGKTWRLDIAPKAVKRVSSTWKPLKWTDKGFTIVAELLENGKVIDTASHEAHVWLPKAKKEYMTVENGDFMLNGKRWRANGVNYMPSSGIAMEDGDYFEHWIGSRAYDPEVIERDIRIMKDMGLNSVSIFIYHQSMKAQNLLDILRRLEIHGMKVNLSMRPGTPMNFLWPEMKEIIEYYRLKDNDTVFAYDLAWEPWHGSHDARTVWDGEWEKWVIERYGSIENAERDWKYKIPRDKSGKVTNPSHEHFLNGEWYKMIAAYRRFLDTLLYKKYNAARTLVKSIDPNHMVSFRMSEAGNPTLRASDSIPYDFPYLATAVDILEPEGYGRIGEWENVRPGIFQYEYGRWAAPSKPFVWSEAGYSAWDKSILKSSDSNLQYQGEYLKRFYDMLIQSGADGIYFWWYPGGFRYGENSDYGIINPDGTDRPSTKTIRENGLAFINGPDAKPNDSYFIMDRDKHPIGFAGVYYEIEDDYWLAREQGKTPGLKTEGTGTTSADVPLISVGNSVYSGSTPLKYLDSAIDKVELSINGGKWKEIEKNGVVKVNANKPLKVRISLTNVGEAKWLASNEAGGVWLDINGVNSGNPIPNDVPYQGSAVISGIKIPSIGSGDRKIIEFRLKAIARAAFGERFRIELYAE